VNPETIAIYHITSIENLDAILAAGGLLSDLAMQVRNPTQIGYSHIKMRRLTEIQVPCCANRFVGEFVPFYFCPRTPMLFTINKGNTGLPPGCQKDIVHLVSNVQVGITLARPWAVSDGNAGSYSANFDASLASIQALDWDAIRANSWSGRQHQKQAEFLVHEFFPWEGIREITCYNQAAVDRVVAKLAGQQNAPAVSANSRWYY
jgi:hypothetical protein